jgi:hypothetical protein
MTSGLRFFDPRKPTTRRRVYQVLIALAFVALVIAQGLLESSQGLTPNH